MHRFELICKYVDHENAQCIVICSQVVCDKTEEWVMTENKDEFMKLMMFVESKKWDLKRTLMEEIKKNYGEKFDEFELATIKHKSNAKKINMNHTTGSKIILIRKIHSHEKIKKKHTKGTAPVPWTQMFNYSHEYHSYKYTVNMNDNEDPDAPIVLNLKSSDKVSGASVREKISSKLSQQSKRTNMPQPPMSTSVPTMQPIPTIAAMQPSQPAQAIGVPQYIPISSATYSAAAAAANPNLSSTMFGIMNPTRAAQGQGQGQAQLSQGQRGGNDEESRMKYHKYKLKYLNEKKNNGSDKW